MQFNKMIKHVLRVGCWFLVFFWGVAGLADSPLRIPVVAGSEGYAMDTDQDEIGETKIAGSKVFSMPVGESAVDANESRVWLPFLLTADQKAAILEANMLVELSVCLTEKAAAENLTVSIHGVENRTSLAVHQTVYALSSEELVPAAITNGSALGLHTFDVTDFVQEEALRVDGIGFAFLMRIDDVALLPNSDASQNVFRVGSSISADTNHIPCLIVSEVSVPVGNYDDLLAPHIDGRLEYHAFSSKGDTLFDASMVGFRNGMDLTGFCEWSVKQTLSPSTHDTIAIQAAVDEISLLPLNTNGFRGSLFLQSGLYRITNTITIAASGVVIEGILGETFIEVDSTNQIDAFFLDGGFKNHATWGDIVSEYVPVGSRILTLDDASAYSIGDKIGIQVGKNNRWVEKLGIDPAVWPPETYQVRYERCIVDKSGDTILLDIPLVDPLTAEFGFGKVCKIYDSRIYNIGLQNLTLSSTFDSAVVEYDAVYGITNSYCDENHPWKAIHLDNVTDAFVKNIDAYHFGYSLVHLDNNASFVTVSECSSFEPVSKSNVGSRRYTFCVDGQLNLIQDCFSERGRHDYVQQDRTCGPNVFFNCTATNGYDFNEAHQKWGTGGLYDNVSIQGRTSLQATDRRVIGEGEHGWAAANQVFFNCTAPVIWVQNVPLPGVNNFVVGGNAWVNDSLLAGIQSYLDNNFPAYDPNLSGAVSGDGWTEREQGYTSVPSLYLQQVLGRMNDSDYNILPGILMVEAEDAGSMTGACEVVSGHSAASGSGSIRFTSTSATGEAQFALADITGFTNGNYNLQVVYFDESDGEASLSVYINTELLESIVLDENLNSDSYVTVSNKTVLELRALSLTTNDTLRLVGQKEAADWACVDRLVLTPARIDLLEQDFALAENIDEWQSTATLDDPVVLSNGVSMVASGYDAKIYRVESVTLPAGTYEIALDGAVFSGYLQCKVRQGSFGTTVHSFVMTSGQDGQQTSTFTLASELSSWTLEVKAANPDTELLLRYLRIRRK